MAKTFTFRITAEGVDQFRKDLEALGPAGQDAFNKLTQASPSLENALKRAQEQAAKTRDTLDRLGKDGTPALKALGAAGDDVLGRFNELAGRVPVLGSAMQALGPAGTVAAAGVGAVVAVLTAGAAEAGKYEQSFNRVQGVLRATGNQSGVTARDLARLAEELTKTTNATEEGVLDAASALATFRGISGEAFTDILKRGQDMAALFGGDLRSNALTIARTFQNLAQGESAGLAKSFSFIGAEARGAIASLIAVGDNAGAARVFLDSLQKTVAGAGEADRSGLTGAFKGLGDAWSDFLKEVGKTQGFMTDAVNAVTGGVRSIQESMTPEGQVRSLDSDIAGVTARQGAGVGTSRLAGGRNRFELSSLQFRRDDLARELEDKRQGEELRRGQAADSASAAADEDAAAALKARKKAIDDFNDAQKRQLEIAGQVAAEREQAAAADKAEADLRAKVKDATKEEVAAARAAAVAITERRQATEAATQADKEMDQFLKKLIEDLNAEDEKRKQTIDSINLSADGIRRETEVMGLDESQRRVLTEVMQAENELRRAKIDLQSEEAKAALENVRAAAEEREAKRKVIDAQKEAIADAKRLAERSTDDVTRYIGDKFADVFSKTKGGWREVWNDAVSTAKSALLRIAAEAVIRPIIAPIIGNILGVPNTGGGSGSAGVNPLAFLGIGTGGVGAAAGGGGLMNNPAVNIGQNALSLANQAGLFGDTFSFLSPSTWFGAGAAAASTIGAGAGGAAGFGFTGALADATIAGTYLGGATSVAAGAGGAAASGAAAGGLSAGLAAIPIWGWIAAAVSIIKGFTQGKDPRSPVGLFNTLLGPSPEEWMADPRRSIAGAANPVGLAIGDLIGNKTIAAIINPFTMLGSKNPGFVGGTAKLGITDEGRLTNLGAVGKRVDLEKINQTAAQFVDSFNQTFDALGLTFGKRNTGYFTGIGFGQGAVVPIEKSLTSLLSAGDVRSGNDELDAKIKSYFTGEFDSPSGKDIAALVDDLGGLVGIFRAVEEVKLPTTEELSQTEQMIKSMNEDIDALKIKAQALGLTDKVAQLEAKRQTALADLKEGFDHGVQLQILAFTDPLSQALESLKDSQEARLREAKASGADLVEVEKLSALERKRVLQQANEPIEQLLKALTGTASSPLGLSDVLKTAEDNFNSVRARVLGGDNTARPDLAVAAGNLLDVSRAAFASGPQFFERFNFVVATLENILGITGGSSASGASATVIGSSPAVQFTGGISSPGLQGYANGTDSAPPGWAWVGERGKELVRFRGGEQVLPNGVRPRAANDDAGRAMTHLADRFQAYADRAEERMSALERTQSQLARLVGKKMAGG